MRRYLALLVAGAAVGCGLLSGLDHLQVADASAPDVEPIETSVGEAGPTGSQPPPPPDAGTPVSQVLTFAIRQLFIGDSNRDGTTSANAWQQYGYDLDGKTTTSMSTDVCKPVSGGQTVADSPIGIDNSFGENVLPMLKAFNASFTSVTVSDQIDKGAWTLLFEVDGLGNDPGQSSIGLTTQAFQGAALSTTPTFDSTTNWPVLSSSLVDGNSLASGALLTFKSSYVNGGTFVSGIAPVSIPVQLSGVQGQTVTLQIHHAIVTFQHISPDVGASGIIAGVLDTEEFVNMILEAAARTDSSLCTSASVQSILNQIRQASDIFLDGTNAPTGQCTGISIGLGFEARVIANPTTITTAPMPPPDPCGG